MLIFLDIDGVMVPIRSWRKPELLSDGFPAFSTEATNALNKIINANTHVILTTSHRSNYSLSKWMKIFRDRGLEISSLDSIGKYVQNLSRCDEIVNWINRQENLRSFLIIDDDKSLNALPQKLKERLVLTKSMIGLTTEDLKNALLISDSNRNVA